MTHRLAALVTLSALAASSAMLSPTPATAQAPAAAPAGAVSPGQALAFDRSKGTCLACHTMKGGDVPSDVGPELIDMKSRFPDPKQLAAIIYDEESRNPQTVMPAFGKNLILSPPEIQQIVQFLYTL
jgi:sulfur-oxidizing protein SoxX